MIDANDKDERARRATRAFVDRVVEQLFDGDRKAAERVIKETIAGERRKQGRPKSTDGLELYTEILVRAHREGGNPTFPLPIHIVSDFLELAEEERLMNEQAGIAESDYNNGIPANGHWEEWLTALVPRFTGMTDVKSLEKRVKRHLNKMDAAGMLPPGYNRKHYPR